LNADRALAEHTRIAAVTGHPKEAGNSADGSNTWGNSFVLDLQNVIVGVAEFDLIDN